MSRRVMNYSLVGVLSLLTAACVSGPDSDRQSINAWTTQALSAALATPTRSQTDRDRDADRKPAELMVFFGVERGMTVVDLMAGGGFMTEVLSITVGPTGKVYAQNAGPNASLDQHLANDRLPNTVKVTANFLPVPPGSVDAIVTVMNLHDLYNSDLPLTQAALKYFYDVLKPNGVLGVVDHVGVAGANNAKLHRMLKHQALEVVTAAGFVLEAESEMYARSTDDHTRLVTDPSLRGRTDQFTLRFRKRK